MYSSNCCAILVFASIIPLNFQMYKIKGRKPEKKMVFFSPSSNCNQHCGHVYSEMLRHILRRRIFYSLRVVQLGLKSAMQEVAFSQPRPHSSHGSRNALASKWAWSAGLTAKWLGRETYKWQEKIKVGNAFVAEMPFLGTNGKMETSCKCEDGRKA